MIGNNVVGTVTPSMETLARYHPQFALAIAMGVKPTPNNRILQVTFDSGALPQIKPASFDSGLGQQMPGFVDGYAVFTGFNFTIDPTSAFPGSVFKNQSDVAQSQVTGITFNLTVRSAGRDYVPIPFDVPLQLVPGILNPTAGMWSMGGTDNVKAIFTLATPPNDARPITVWCTFSFLVVGLEAYDLLCKSPEWALAELKKRGILCCGESS